MVLRDFFCVFAFVSPVFGVGVGFGFLSYHSLARLLRQVHLKTDDILEAAKCCDLVLERDSSNTKALYRLAKVGCGCAVQHALCQHKHNTAVQHSVMASANIV